MPVHPLTLKRYPVRTEIPLLKHMGSYAQCFRMGNSGSMNRSPIAKEHLVGNLIAPVQRIEKCRRLRRQTTIPDRLTGAPICHISRVEIYFMDEMTIRLQRIRQAGKKWGTHPL